MAKVVKCGVCNKNKVISSRNKYFFKCCGIAQNINESLVLKGVSKEDQKNNEKHTIIGKIQEKPKKAEEINETTNNDAVIKEDRSKTVITKKKPVEKVSAEEIKEEPKKELKWWDKPWFDFDLLDD